MIRQASIVSDLEKVTEDQDRILKEYKESLQEEVLAEQEYKGALAKAGLTASGTVFEKENKAFLESADQRLYAKLAEANTKSLVMHLSILKSNVEAAKIMSYSIDSENRASGLRT